MAHPGARRGISSLVEGQAVFDQIFELIDSFVPRGRTKIRMRAAVMWALRLANCVLPRDVSRRPPGGLSVIPGFYIVVKQFSS